MKQQLGISRKNSEVEDTMWQLDPSGRMKDRLQFAGYRSGHMMYLRAEDLGRSTDYLRAFIRSSTPAAGAPAKY